MSENIKLMRKFSPYYKKYRKTVAFDLFCAGMSTAGDVILPLLVRSITDRGINDLASLTVSYVLKLAAIYFIIKIISVAANYYMSSVGHIMGAKIETDMRRDMFAHLQKLSFSFYDEAKVGTLMSRLSNDLFDITEFSHHCPEEFFIAGVKFIAFFCILSTMNVWLTLIIFAIIPVMCVFLSYFNSKMRQGNRESRVKIGELNAVTEDSLSGIRVVQSFANEKREQARFDDGNGKILDIKHKIYTALASFHAAEGFFDGLLYITVVTAGALFIIKGSITAPDLVVYLMYVSTLISTVKRIVEFMDQFNRGMTGIERFYEIMDEEPEITDEKNAVEMKDVRGDIEFKDVTFSYKTGNGDVLSHISLKISAGQNIALVGPSGGGKTTLCSLIPRFYEPVGGEITVDGVNIKNYTLTSLREHIGVVQQDVYIFSGTVRDNIAYGKTDASDEEIIKASVYAGADEFIRSMPDGYDTYVGERGVKLSGGQKQKLSIARAFLKNPPILILDEATSALDNESERAVQLSLEGLSKGRTTLTIAHRLTTVKNADKILVITPDGIAESGTHEELLNKNGIYANMYKMYT
ncbi:MAG: ABC transporter ATP-binding protein [Oscillospiraceae bacterium]|nr:ABC transporter ATP-binding protein/permease [Oscillospiraceae bacterium]MDD7354160.1 ABC transporter ATP-binding protein [Oscillospiraceae bacterium]